MKTGMRTGTVWGVAAGLTSLLVIAGAAFAAEPAGGGLCEGYDAKHSIERLGSRRTSFVPGGVTSKEALVEALTARRAEVEALLASRSLGHLADKLYAALANPGEGTVEPGQILPWMSYRKRREATTEGPMCLATKKAYEAYTVTVDEKVELPPPPVAAEVAAKASDRCDPPHVWVDAAGSSPGVRVTRNGESIALDPSLKWDGPAESGKEYLFEAKVSAQGKRKVTAWDFTIPKVCGNLSLAGVRTWEEPGATVSDEASARVTVPMPPPPPSCTISAPAEVWEDDEFQVTLTAGPESTVEFTTWACEDGTTGPAAATMSLPRPGHCTIHGKATNPCGETAACSAAGAGGAAGEPGEGGGGEGTPIVVKPRWRARFYGAWIKTDDGTLVRDGVAPGLTNVPERSEFWFGSGGGVGAGLEYLFSDRVGIDTHLILGRIYGELMLDQPNLWVMEKDKSVDMVLATVGPAFHLTPQAKVDLFLEPFVGLLGLDDTRFHLAGRDIARDHGTELGVGLLLGLDVPVGDGPWGLHFGARYLDVDVDVGADSLALDPIVGTFGAAYRF